ncbi:MAG: hypothetical protein EPGJADBJ_00479 [Saprospiraceae bacterium]|nr:hypothetical protein [Saprospiraceae bacterium]
MHKHFLLFILLLTATAVQAQTSAKKYVLIEHFTNSKCGICASKNPAFYTLINQYPDDIHHISIHPNFPYPSCGLHQANPSENAARTSFYGVFGTPTVVLNGELQPITSSLLTQTTLQEYLGGTSPIWLQVTESGTGSARTATVKVHSLSSVPSGNYKIFAAVVEKTVNYAGGNGETVHHDVFRDMVSDINGDNFTPAAAGQSVEFDFNFNTAANWNADEIYILAWIQHATTKEVLNSGTRFDPPVLSGTNEAAAQTIRVQPNPVREMAFAQIGDDAAKQVEIFTANGQRMALTFDDQEAGTIGIPTASLARGIYFVKITGEKGVYVAKMVKN